MDRRVLGLSAPRHHRRPIDYRASPVFLARVVTIVSARLILIGQDVPPFMPPAGVPVWKLHELDWVSDGAAPPTQR
jgi:hypothetical protein